MTASAFEMIDRMRQGKPRSLFVESLLEAESAERSRRDFYEAAVSAYAPAVAAEILWLNADERIDKG
jgi:hypothetical protein